MVSECVTNVGLVIQNTASPAASGSGNVNNATECFQKLMLSSNNVIAENVNVESTDTREFAQSLNQIFTNSIEDSQVMQNILKNITYKDSGLGTLSEEDIAKVSDTLMNCMNQIMNMIQNTFSISKEELDCLMQENGIKATDLLTNAGLTEVFTKLSPNQDIFNLLTNTQYSATMKELFALVNDTKTKLFSEFNLDSTGFDQFIKEFNVSLTQELTVANEAAIDSAQASEESIIQKIRNTQNVVVENAVEPIHNQEVTNNTQSVSESNVKVTIETDKEVVAPVEQTKDNTGNSSNGEESTSDGMGQTFFNKITEILQDANEAVDSVKVMKQIVDEVKITMKQGIDKMELQLNPEHLGKISLEVSSKDGVLTAQITAQSLAVKEAIEANLPMLRESLQEQGLKVESVEVTVASHEFEQNLSGNNNDNAKNQSGKRKQMIHLEDLEGLADGKSLEDSLEEQRMEIEGNSVSLKA